MARQVALAFQLCATDEEDDGGDEDTAPAPAPGRRGGAAPRASLPTVHSEPTRTASEAQDAALAQQLEDAHQEISSLKAHIQELVMKGHRIQQEPPPPRQQLRLMPAAAAAGAAADPQEEEETTTRRAASEALRAQGFSPRQIEEAEAGMRRNGLPFTPQTVRAISQMLLTLTEIGPADAEAGDDGLPPAITPSQTSVTDDARPPPVAAGSSGERARSPAPEPEQSEHHPEPPLDQGEHSPGASAEETLGVILRRAHPSPEVRLSSLGKPAADTAEADRGSRDGEEGKRQGEEAETVAAAAAAAPEGDSQSYSAAERAEIERSAQDALRAIADDGVSLDGNPGAGPGADAHHRDLSCPEGDAPAAAPAPAAAAAVPPQLSGGTPQPRSAQGGGGRRGRGRHRCDSQAAGHGGGWGGARRRRP
eukprot:COSAG01_NODE_1002_length_12208_cov_63.234701_9_plen_422_part_00